MEIFWVPFAYIRQRSGIKSKFIWSQFTVSGLKYQWYMIKRKFLGILKLYKTKKWLQDNLSWFEIYQSSLNILVLVAMLRTEIFSKRGNCFWIFMIQMNIFLWFMNNWSLSNSTFVTMLVQDGNIFSKRLNKWIHGNNQSKKMEIFHHCKKLLNYWGKQKSGCRIAIPDLNIY